MALAFLALAWLLGIAAAAFTGADPAASLAASGLLGAVTFARRPHPPTLALITVGAALIFLAGWRYDATRPGPSPVARFNDGPAVQLRAAVTDEPVERSSYRVYRLQVRESFERGRWGPDAGGVLMYAPLLPQYEFGDLLELNGQVETPPELPGFDYRAYLLRHGIGSVLSYPDATVLQGGHGSRVRTALAGIRRDLSESLSDLLPEPQASLATGALLGAGSTLPRDLEDAMNATGTSHLVAVSGQNVSILAGLIMAALAWLIGRRPAAWAALLAIIGYAGLVGMQPSVIRAAIMGAIWIVSIAIGRQNTAAVGLLLAGAAMTAWHPQLAHDVSFQLSFAATLGLIVLAPPLARATEWILPRHPDFTHSPVVRSLVDTLTMTLAAIAFTLPITAINFHRISLIAPLANLFAVPAFVAVALTSALAATVDLVLPVDARILGWLAWLPAAYTIAVVRFLARVPALSLSFGSLGTPLAIAWYAGLFGLTGVLERIPVPPAAPVPVRIHRHYRQLALPAAVGTVLTLSALIVWLVAAAPTPDRVSVTFLDVGQGDAILVEDPSGHRVLVDGGPGAGAIEAALGRNLPFYDRRIDLVVLTHPQADHMGGLPSVLDHYDVGAALAPAVEAGSSVFRVWQAALLTTGVPRIEPRRGQRISLSDRSTLTVLAPAVGSHPTSDPNEDSVVLKLTAGNVSFLLTGDIGEKGEQALIQSGTDLRADVLKIAHHGSSTSTSPAFLNRVAPTLDVISVAADSQFGHPDEDVLARLTGDLVLRTSDRGDITVSTDGERIWVQTRRSGN